MTRKSQVSGQDRQPATRKKTRVKRAAARTTKDAPAKKPDPNLVKPRSRDAKGRLYGGNPGNKGGRRYPDWFKDWCAKMVTGPGARKSVRAILRNPDHPQFSSLWDKLANRAYGRPKESLDVNAKVTLEDLLTRSRELDDEEEDAG